MGTRERKRLKSLANLLLMSSTEDSAKSVARITTVEDNEEQNGKKEQPSNGANRANKDVFSRPKRCKKNVSLRFGYRRDGHDMGLKLQ